MAGILRRCHGTTMRTPFCPAREWQKPSTLRAQLEHPSNKDGRSHSLSHRLPLAQNIALAVLYAHSSRFVHKSFRSETSSSSSHASL